MVEIRAPLVATFEITGRCTCDCTYCYARRDGFQRRDIPAKRAIEIIRLLLGLGVFHVSIAGGEPLLHPDFDRIICETFPGNRNRLIVISNGLPLLRTETRDRFRRSVHAVQEADGRPIYLQISLDSVDGPTNEATRPGGACVLDAIEYALELPVDLVLAAVVTTKNLGHIVRTMEHFWPRVRRFHVMNLMPWMGCTRAEYEDLNPSPDQMREVEDAILEFERSHVGALVTHLHEDTPSGLKGESSVVSGVGCLGGTTRVNIDSELNVRPCCMAREVLGNLNRQTFEEIWYSHHAEQVRADPLPYCFRNLDYDLPTFMRMFAKQRTGPARSISMQEL